MQRFNLSKFYTLNWLLWSILLGNFILLLLSLFEKLKHSSDVFLFFFVTEVNLLFFFMFLIFILFTTIIEIILRKTQKITTYNILIMPKRLRIILVSLVIVLFIIDFITFRVSFFFVDLFLNGPNY